MVLRGASKDVLKEVERNLMDAMCVARNVVCKILHFFYALPKWEPVA